MATDIKTYTYGFHIKVLKSITKDDYVTMCKKITVALNERFDPHEKRFLAEPEAITEGGIVLSSFPGKTRTAYKTMRHPMCMGTRNIGGICVTVKDIEWPDFRRSPPVSWEFNPTELFPKGSESWTCLKAFQGASRWKLTELRIIAGVMEDCGLECSQFPKGKDLIAPRACEEIM